MKWLLFGIFKVYDLQLIEVVPCYFFVYLFYGGSVFFFLYDNVGYRNDRKSFCLAKSFITTNC